MVGGSQQMKKLLALAAPIAAALTLFSCSDMFQERIAMQHGSNNVNLANMFNASKSIEKLDAPEQIFVTNGEYADKIIVSWKEVKGARSYSIERAISSEKDANGNWLVPDEGDYDFLERSKFISGTSYTDTIIDNSPANVLDYTNEAYNCAYFYRVSAQNSIDNYESSDYTYSESFGSLLSPPSNVKASCGASATQIEVSWTKAPGSIASYRIYRSSNADGSGSSQIGTVYGNKYSYTVGVEADQQGDFFYFTVVAVGSSGIESVTSSVALGYALKGGAPSQVTGVTVKSGRGNTTGKIELEWEPASGSGTINYRVYRYTSVDSTLKQLKDNDDKTAKTYEDKTGLKPNVFYYYQVQAYSVDADNNELIGQMSDSGDTSENPAEGYLLSPPQSLTVQKIQGSISNNRILFSAAIGSSDCATNSAITDKKMDYNNYSYKVYASNTTTGAFTEVASFTGPTKSNDNPGFYVETAPDYKFYKMTTVNGTAESDFSALVAPAPFAAQNFEASKNAAVPGYTDVVDRSKAGFPSEPQANANGVHAIKLTWQTPAGGADGGYNIYRSTKPVGGFKKINESPVTDLYYIFKDEQAKAGTCYYYRVLSLNSLGQGANYSNVDFGYGALTTYQYVREYIKTTLNSQKKLTLMHKSGATDKLGSESSYGDHGGSLSYNASIAGLGGRVIMHYDNYADYYIMSDNNLYATLNDAEIFTINRVPSFWLAHQNDKGKGYHYFLLNGNTNTSASMDTNGTMDGTVTVQGMYPGSVVYDGIKIKGGAAGGGTYGVTRTGIDSSAVQADWTWGEK